MYVNVSCFQQEESDFVGQKLEEPEIHHFMVCGSTEDQLLSEFLVTVDVQYIYIYINVIYI